MCDQAATLSHISHVACLARSGFEQAWPVWRALFGAPSGDAPSFQACVPSSIALCNILQRQAPEYSWQIRGGRPTSRTPQGGYLDDSGQANPHLWVEGKRRGQRPVIIDVTADQFSGGPPVVVQFGPSHRHRANATQCLLDSYRDSQHASVELFEYAVDELARTVENKNSGKRG